MVEKDNAGVVAPPPLIFLTGLLAGGAITYFYPLLFLPKWIGIGAGLVPIAAGLWMILSAFFGFQKAKTDVKPWKPTTAIVAEGFYRYTRNPMYVGMALIYLGVTFAINSIWFLPFLLIVLLVMHYGVILREEKYLEKKFGESYMNYKSQVRRWI